MFRSRRMFDSILFAAALGVPATADARPQALTDGGMARYPDGPPQPSGVPFSPGAMAPSGAPIDPTLPPAAGAGVGGGAAPGAGPARPLTDNIEPLNRAVYSINDMAYAGVIRPVSVTYGNIVKDKGRQGVRRFFRNLSTPASAVNCLLQGRPLRAGQEVERFAINSTVGILGAHDPAADTYGIQPAEQDFGLAMAHWGVPHGSAVQLPLIGSSSVRDTAGLVVDVTTANVLNPLAVVGPAAQTQTGAGAGRGVNATSFQVDRVDEIRATAPDPYITFRDAWAANREQGIGR